MRAVAEKIKFNADRSKAMIIADAPSLWSIEKRQISGATIIYHDGRMLSPNQRKKIFALSRDISEWWCDTPEYVRAYFTDWFCGDHPEKAEYKDRFSLSPRDPDVASMTVAKEFITWLIEFCIKWDVPTRKHLREYAEDEGRLFYALLVNRKCFVCGKGGADCHHAETRIGMGRDRRKIIHEGMQLMTLCREHHTECHSAGQETFNRDHRVFSIKADEHACRVLGLHCEVS